MIIHNPDSKRLPHEGLEYYHKSKEPETIQECSDLFCWYCIHYNTLVPTTCRIRQKLREKNDYNT